jgi:sec-independent protein translocase protein TatA
MMNLYVLLGMIGPWQAVIIVVALLLLFGGRKIPELMKGLGQGMKEFKKATKDESGSANPQKEIESKTEE